MRIWIFVLGLFCIFSGANASASEPGQDLPFLSRYPGSVMDEYKTAQFDEVTIPLGPLGKNGLTRSETVRGKATYIRYKVPEDRSPLEFINNYQQALQGAGFRILWQCANKACRTPDGEISTTLWPDAPTQRTGGAESFLFENGRMLTAEHRTANGVRTLVFVNDNTEYGHSQVASVYAVQTLPMQSGMVTSGAGQLTSQGMASALAQQGRFAMHLPFDFNKATLRPDALPTVVELARLMQQYPALRVRLEGHTDMVGTASYNQRLSQERAVAVKAALVAQGVGANRMQTAGFGATRPVADNATEAGRAQNRRVEVIDLTPGVIPASRPVAPGNTQPLPNTAPPPSLGPRADIPAPRSQGAADLSNVPSSEFARTATDAARDETNYQIRQGVRSLMQGLLGN